MFSQLSPLRHSQYELISLLELYGKILDLGGSIKSGYQPLIKGKHEFTTVNIDKNYGCDLVFDIEKKFLITKNTYNHILCINVFEHICDFQNVLQESYRVLKPGGSIIISTPFMYHLHACPNDYFRYTDQAFRQILNSANFQQVNIKPLTKGLMSLIVQLTLEAFPSPILRPMAKYSSGAVDRLLNKISRRYQLLSNRTPLGYFVTAVKTA